MHFLVATQSWRSQKLTVFLDADLSTKLETTLKNDASNDETLDYYLTDVEGSLHVVNMWLSSSPCVGSSTLRKLDAQGQVLWNLCVRLRRDVKTEILGSKKNRLVLHVWLLGFQFLELGRQRVMEKDEAVETAYVLELVLTVTSASVNDSEFGVARLALQRGAAYVSKSEFAVHKQECSNTLVVRLLATYYTMRMLLVSDGVGPSITWLMEAVMAGGSPGCNRAHV